MKFFLKTAVFVFAFTISLILSVVFADRAFAANSDIADIAENDNAPVRENGYTEFTGEFEPENFANYYIDGVLKINEGESFSFPRTTILTVRKNAELQIYVGGAVEIKGALIIEQGARVTVSGELKAYGGSRIECFGEFVSTGKSAVMLAGEFSNSESSAVVFGGVTNLYKTGVYKNNGITTFSNSANATISGNYNVAKSGRLLIKGSFSTTLNAKVEVSGYIYLSERSGKYYNTGELILNDGAVVVLEGRFATGKSGRVFDLRTDTQDNSDQEADDEGNKTSPIGKSKLLRGIDVSYWQGTIDWEKVKASGIDFAFMRTTLGDYYTDETFYYNITEAQRNGIKVGVYHYMKADSSQSARTEAKYFLEAIKDYELEFPIVVDVEDSRQEKLSVSELTRITRVFCEEIKKAGYTPMIYSSASWLNQKLDTKQLSDYEIWVAHWGTTRPAYYGSYGVWQYSCKGRVSGISGDVDLNVAYIDYSKK